MEQLGHIRFRLVGHDRGARVGYRLALDHPERLEKLAMIDIIPTAARWQALTRRGAEGLSLDVPGAARAVAGDADRRARPFYRRFHAGELDRRERLSAFDPRALPITAPPSTSPRDSRRLRGLSRRGDARPRRRRSRPGRRPQDHSPASGALGRARALAAATIDPRRLARMGHNVQGEPIAGGHFLPEENPEATLEALLEFL